MSPDQIKELLSAYSLGTLNKEGRRQVEELLASGDSNIVRIVEDFQQVVGTIGFESKAVTPPAAAKSKLMAAISKIPQEHTIAPGDHIIRREEGIWDNFRPGLHLKRLYASPDGHHSTFLLRMDPQSSLPRHVHHGVEEVYVLEGTCRQGGIDFYAGDYLRADAESIHEVATSESGCLLMVIMPQFDFLT